MKQIHIQVGAATWHVWPRMTSVENLPKVDGGPYILFVTWDFDEAMSTAVLDLMVFGFPPFP